MNVDVNSLSQRFMKVASGHVCDALEHEGIRTPALPSALKPMTPAVRFAGPAATLKLALSRTGSEARRIDGLREALTPGDVMLLDGQGIRDFVLFGLRAATGSIRKRAAAAIIYGSTRDVPEYQHLGFPIFALGPGLRASEGHFMSVGINVDVIIGGVLVEPGDWLVGDDTGICVVPKALTIRVLELAEEREQIDNQSLVEIRAGKSMSEAHRHFHDDDVAKLRAIE